jgi:DNA-binding transcriptional MerR regulator
MEVMPIDLSAVLGIVMGSLMVLIPVTGFTLRFALKPIAEAVAKMRDAESSDRATAILEQRVALLEQQLGGLETDMRQLEEAETFRRELEAPPEA